MNNSRLVHDPVRGLRNYAGENNCFLNVVVQALWNLESFRTRFQRWNDHSHRTPDGKGNGQCVCAHCALSVIFTQYRYADSPVIPPNVLRETMHQLYASEGRFQIGEIDDAAELLQALMETLHTLNEGDMVKLSSTPSRPTPHLTAGKPRSEDECVAHKVFGLDKLEQVQCDECGASAEPMIGRHFIHYAYVTNLLKISSKGQKADFNRVMREASMECLRSCPSEDGDITSSSSSASRSRAPCKARCRVKQYLLNVPYVLALGLVWETPDPSVNEIHQLLSLVRDKISLQSMFGMDDGYEKGSLPFRLRGMICYYGKHYACYFYSESRKKWLVFDDVIVRAVGDTYVDVANQCLRGRFHPSVLFYERIPGQNYHNLAEEKAAKEAASNPTTIGQSPSSSNNSVSSAVVAQPGTDSRRMSTNVQSSISNARLPVMVNQQAYCWPVVSGPSSTQVKTNTAMEISSTRIPTGEVHPTIPVRYVMSRLHSPLFQSQGPPNMSSLMPGDQPRFQLHNQHQQQQQLLAPQAQAPQSTATPAPTKIYKMPSTPDRSRGSSSLYPSIGDAPPDSQPEKRQETIVVPGVKQPFYPMSQSAKTPDLPTFTVLPPAQTRPKMTM